VVVEDEVCAPQLSDWLFCLLHFSFVFHALFWGFLGPLEGCRLMRASVFFVDSDLDATQEALSLS
tara:strand:+ start:223 stop:417 length:195 start_codon:yes stop_codon:yes gene_type:complete